MHGIRTAAWPTRALGSWRESFGLVSSLDCPYVLRSCFVKLRASKEKYLGEHHTIDDDGYNVGRDFIVDRALAGSRWKGMWWIAEVEWEESLLKPGADGMYLLVTSDMHAGTRLNALFLSPRHQS